MVRRVNFEAQQRVDQPDAMALQAFQTQDLRRVLRRMVSGESAGRVLDGFAVEAENPGVSPRILVRLDVGGTIGSFLGAVDQGGGQLDHGQLAGDRDGLGNLEGSAQNIVDFTGQPVAVYEVKVRTTFVPGVADNRAFWNDGTSSEFIKSTNTRLLPQWEVAITGHASADWVSIGTVDWDGVSVQANDIVDTRVFPVEGAPRTAGTTAAERWGHDTQNNATTFGVGDFNRSADRSTTPTSSVWGALRALARQVQDLKGGRETDNYFDWFSRIFAPAGFLAADPADLTTKTLRSIDVVTYTVADGVTEQGDFNGAAGLHSALVFVAANAASLPRRIKIVVKTRQGAASFTWPTAVTIPTGVAVEISVVGATAVGSAGHGSDHGLAAIDPAATGALTGALLTVVGTSSLEVRNVSFLIPPLAVLGWLHCEPTARLVLDSCQLYGSGVTEPVLRCGDNALKLTNCAFQGLVHIGGLGAGAAVVTDVLDNTSSYGMVEGCIFSGLVRFRYLVGAGAAITDQYSYAKHTTYKSCTFVEAVTVGQPASADGQLDLSGARYVTFEQCRFFYHGDQTCVRGLGSDFFGGNYIWPAHIAFRDSFFRQIASATHAGFITGAGGAGGSNGTGWAVEFRASEAGVNPTVFTQCPVDITIDNCRFRGGAPIYAGDPGGAFVNMPSDAGWVRFVDAKDCSVLRSKGYGMTKPNAGNASDLPRLFAFGGTVAGLALGAANGYRFSGNTVDQWNETGTSWEGCRLWVLELERTSNAHVSDNIFSARMPFGTFADIGATSYVLELRNTENTHVVHNKVFNFRDPTSGLASRCFSLDADNTGLVMSDNLFTDCGGDHIFAQVGSTLLGAKFADNLFIVGDTAANFNRMIDLNAATADFIFITGNSWDYDNATVKAAIRLPDVTRGMLSANHFYNGTIAHTVGAAAPYAQLRGYAEAGQDLNFVQAYL